MFSYIFPPFLLLPQIHQAWYAILAALLVEAPWRLPLKEDLLPQGTLFNLNLATLLKMVWVLKLPSWDQVIPTMSLFQLYEETVTSFAIFPLSSTLLPTGGSGREV